MIGENESIGYEKLLGQGPNHLTFGILIEQKLKHGNDCNKDT